MTSPENPTPSDLDDTRLERPIRIDLLVKEVRALLTQTLQQRKFEITEKDLTYVPSNSRITDGLFRFAFRDSNGTLRIIRFKRKEDGTPDVRIDHSIREQIIADRSG